MKEKEQLVVEAIKNGTVIDHIPTDRTLQIVDLLTDPDDCYFLGVNLGSTSVGKKGIVKLQDKVLTKSNLEILSALAPQATMNIIKDFKIVDKMKLQIPDEVIKVFVCPNTRCITNHEVIDSRFRLGNGEHTCAYCERSFSVDRLRTHPSHGPHS